MHVAQDSSVGTRDEVAVDQEDQGDASRARTVVTSHLEFRTAPRRTFESVWSRQTVLDEGVSASPQLRKFAVHMEQSLEASSRVANSPRRKMHSLRMKRTEQVQYSGKQQRNRAQPEHAERGTESSVAKECEAVLHGRS